MVFRGGRDRLADAVAVQTQVSFVGLYEDQPTIGEIDAEMRRQGFLPHAMVALKHWALAPVIYDGDFRRPMHQLLEADMVYVRDSSRRDDFSPVQLQHLALIAHHVYGSSDLTHLCLLALVARGLISADGPGDYQGITWPASRCEHRALSQPRSFVILVFRAGWRVGPLAGGLLLGGAASNVVERSCAAQSPTSSPPRGSSSTWPMWRFGPPQQPPAGPYWRSPSLPQAANSSPPRHARRLDPRRPLARHDGTRGRHRRAGQTTATRRGARSDAPVSATPKGLPPNQGQTKRQVRPSVTTARPASHSDEELETGEAQNAYSTKMLTWRGGAVQTAPRIYLVLVGPVLDHER